MKKTVEAWVCMATAVVLFVAGFLVPPRGIIDGSVLKAGGLLLGFASLFQAPELIRSLSKFSAAKFTKGDLSIEVNKENDSDDLAGDNCTVHE